MPVEIKFLTVTHLKALSTGQECNVARHAAGTVIYIWFVASIDRRVGLKLSCLKSLGLHFCFFYSRSPYCLDEDLTCSLSFFFDVELCVALAAYIGTVSC